MLLNVYIFLVSEWNRKQTVQVRNTTGDPHLINPKIADLRAKKTSKSEKKCFSKF